MSVSRKIAEVVVEKNIPVEMLVEVLRSYNLLSLLPSIKKDIEKLSKGAREQNIVQIESPFPLDDAALARIKRIVGNDLAETNTTINKDLLAGFKARWKGRVYDGSAERIIKQLISN